MNDWYSLPGFHQPLSSMSHFGGAVVFAVLSFLLVVPARGDRKRFWSLVVFASSAVVLLSLSGLYHMFAPGGAIREVMLRLDVAAIFVLIAGSFTPLHGVLFRGWKRWGILVPVWAAALGGVALRSIYFDQIPDAVGAGMFLLLGWFGALSAYLLWSEYGSRLVAPVVAGGALYTLGALANLAHWPTIIPRVWGPHETLHLAVLAALSCHWHVATHIAHGTLGRRPGKRGLCGLKRKTALTEATSSRTPVPAESAAASHPQSS